MIEKWKNNKLNNFNVENFLTYFIAVILSLLILIWVLQLWKADLKITFSYSGDGLSVSEFIKGMIDNNSIFLNKYVGAPGSLNLAETPMSDGIHILMVKFIGSIVKNYALTINIYYLLTFPLTTVCALYGFLKFKLNKALSVIASLLYTFLPYHIMRGENHLFLSGYFIVPIACAVILIIARGDNFLKPSNNKKAYLWNGIKLMLLGVLIASSGIYYAFFTCFFLLVIGAINVLHNKKLKMFVMPMCIVAMIIFGGVINVAPSLIYNHYNGKNSAAINRSKVEAEIYGLKIAQMLLPETGHRIGFLAAEKEKYNALAPLANENDTASLGIVISMGFLIGIFYLYTNKKDNFLAKISLLNLSAVLFATIGGFSTLFAFLVTNMIRSYNRISVFIAYFSLFILIYVVENFIKHKINIKKYKYLFCALGVLVLCLGILDQTSTKHIPDYAGNKTEFSNDEVFVKAIEKVEPAGTKIFQLPYVPYPESPSPNKMGYYDLFRPYLHSSDLIWSYGTMKGRENDSWQKTVATLDIPSFLKEIYKKGFRGVYIDSFGYENKEEYDRIIKAVSQITGENPVQSNNGRLFYISLSKYKQTN